MREGGVLNLGGTPQTLTKVPTGRDFDSLLAAS